MRLPLRHLVLFVSAAAAACTAHAPAAAPASAASSGALKQRALSVAETGATARPDAKAAAVAQAAPAPPPRAPPAPVTDETRALYAQHCAVCHGPGRLGLTGPALIPEQFERVKPEALTRSILKGLPATQMPPFEATLTEAQASALAALVLSALPAPPTFSDDDIARSRAVFPGAVLTGAPKPTFKADPLNLFLVVELGDHHVTVLDGGTFVPLARQKTRHALHGGIKYSPEGRFAYWVTRDGWVTKYDVWGLAPLAEVRVGINTRNIALSADGRFLMAANTLPRTLVALDAKTLELVKRIDVAGKDGTPSRVAAVYAAPPRKSFIAALKDVPEVWELSWADDARKPYTGLVHDFNPESGEPLPRPLERFPVRRIAVDAVLDDFYFDAGYDNLLGASRTSGGGHVINLVVGRPVAKVPLEGMPHLGSGISFDWSGTRVMATPNIKDGVITVLDTKTWKEVKRLKTLGPGFFLRGHEKAPYAFADVFFGKDKDKLHVIDKKTLTIVKTISPAPGRTTAHTEFTRDGRFVLLSVWEDDGELLVLDAKTLAVVKRLPMRKPSGKYNVFNKISLSEGTSH